MKCAGRSTGLEMLQRELRDMLLADADAVMHGLYCPRCGLQDLARKCLDLAGWEEIEYLNAVARHSA